VLKLQTGVTVTQNGGRGTTTSVYIRGASSGHTLVLIDGVRAASATLGSASLNLLPASIAERIEIIRGPRAAQWGADAIGGVINIITKPNAGEERNRLTAGVGTDAYAQGGYRLVKQVSDKTRLQANLGFERSDGYDFKPDDGESNEYGFEAYNIVLGGEFQLSPAWSGELKGIINKGDVDYDAYGTFDTSEQEQQFLSSTLAYQSQGFESVVSANYSVDDSKTPAYSSEYVTKRTALNWLNSWVHMAGWTVNAGIDGTYDDVSDSSVDYDEKTRYNAAAFAGVFFSKERVNAELSLRVDDNQRYGQNTTYDAALGLNYLPEHQMKASIGTAFKAPSFNQLYYPSYGNPDLEAEESLNTEISFIGGLDRLSYEVTFYHNNIDEMIGYDSSYALTNIDSALIKGVELELGFTTGPIDNEISYVYQDAKDESTDEQLTYRSKDTVKWQASYQRGDWDLAVNLLWFSKRDYYSYTTYANETLPDYGVVNLSVGYQVNSKLRLNSAINNLFDEDYETVGAYNAPGINATLNATYDF
jgi:vitamin B12 transporter